MAIVLNAVGGIAAIRSNHGILTGVFKSSNRLLPAILIIGFAIRLGLGWVEPASAAAIDRLPDQREYLSLGENLLRSHELYFVDPRFEQTIFAYRMPGYPILVAACGASVPVIRVVQGLLDVSTILAVFLIARCLSQHPGTAVLAAVLIAFNPFFIYFSSLILSETLFACLLAWSIYFLFSRQWGWGGLLLLLDCYVRPTGWLLCPVLLTIACANPPAGVAYRLRDVSRRAMIAFVLAVILLGLELYPWAIRNHQRLGVYIWSTTNGGVTAYDGFHTGATGASDQRFIAANSRLKSMNEVERSESLTGEAGRWIAAHRTELPGLAIRKIMRGWSPLPLSLEFGKPAYRLISVSYELPLDVLCVIGLFSSRLTPHAKWLLIAPALLVTLGQIMTVGSIRYRMPAEAPMAVLAATGAMSLLGSLQRKWI